MLHQLTGTYRSRGHNRSCQNQNSFDGASYHLGVSQHFEQAVTAVNSGVSSALVPRKAFLLLRRAATACSVAAQQGGTTS